MAPNSVVILLFAFAATSVSGRERVTQSNGVHKTGGSFNMILGRRNLGMLRLGRCVAFVAAATLLLPFTILVMLADQQYIQGYTSKRIFYQEYILENSTHEEGLLSREKFLEVCSRMDARRDYLANQCSNLGLDDSSHKAYAWEYLINRQYHVIWCNIFKAASTSWMYNFNLMANYTPAFLEKTKAVPLELARKKYARPTVEMIKKAQSDSISFLIVRHPLERLASAYNDKIVHAWPRSFHEKMGHRIVGKYRKKNAKIKEKYPLFEEFVSYVLDEFKAARVLDMHWTPYTGFCTPCKFYFDVILKFETLDEDQRFLIQLARLQDVVKPEWRNSGKGTKTSNTINHLYSRITRPQLNGLYNLYKNDFQLFNYSIESYHKIIKDDDSTNG
ncbi:carbohydrate sulfotransferase 11 isoform X2 [Plutella xylostella]|uniref:carbohydrate sulfotransferase 11 isoform X2 n=1 Tax=Plutella xylostella TaxID=51655 RepID=UPI002032619B|nr:carbohydrate sulfotransferase 11 isoform X2 [Plutella xylostella]